MQGHLPNKVFNPLVQGTGVLSFSKLPIIVNNELSGESIKCNIKEYTIPDLEAEMLYDNFFGHSVVVPTAKSVDFSKVSLSVTFIMDEDLENYSLLYRWLDVYKRLTHRSDKNTPNGKHWDAKQAFCPYADIMLYNNNNRVKTVIRFSHVFINTLSSFSQDFSSDEPITFTATFKFDEFFIYNNMDNINTVLGEYV